MVAKVAKPLGQLAASVMAVREGTKSFKLTFIGTRAVEHDRTAPM